MTGLIVICAGKSWKEQESMELLRTGIILVFGGWVVDIRYCAWSVLGGSFIIGWVVVKKRLGGNILNEDTNKIFYFAYLPKISEMKYLGRGYV